MFIIPRHHHGSVQTSRRWVVHAELAPAWNTSMHLTRGGDSSACHSWQLWLPPPQHSQSAPQGKCQPPLPGQGAVRVGSLGTSPAGPSSGPPSCLHFTVKMQSIPAILITGCCISQQSAHTKEQQTQKMIFQHAFSLSLLFLYNQPSVTGSQARYVQSLLEFVDVTSRSFFL